MERNIPCYLIVAGLFILLKFGFTLADNGDLAFLLLPVNGIVGFLTGSSAVFLPEDGFFHEKLGILIDKSCSGFNFWMLCFLVFSYPALRYTDRPLHKFLSIPVVLLFSYLLAVFVNTSRIFTSLLLQHYMGNIRPEQQDLFHQATGITINLSFLLLSYFMMEKILINKQKNAKFT